MYDVVFSSVAEKQFGKLEHQLQARIHAALERIRIRPEVYVKKLVGESGYRLRVGDYRIIVEIDNGKLIVLVIKIGHRSTIYD